MLIFLVLVCFIILLSTLGFDRSTLKYNRITRKKRYKDFQLFLLGEKFDANVPSYKFYSEIVSQLIILRKKFGSDIDTACREIKFAAQKDFQEANLIKSEVQGIYFQYLFIATFTWIFIFSFQIQLDIALGHKSLLLLLIWQTLGLFLIKHVMSLLRKMVFSGYSKYFKSLYIFKAVLCSSRPLSEALLQARVSELPTRKNLNFVLNSLNVILHNLKVSGRFHTSDLECVISELWNAYRERQLMFKKYVLALKIIFISFFILPGFLFSLGLALQEVMI